MDYCRRWIKTAFVHSYGAVEALSFAVGAVLGVIGHYLPREEGALTALEWQLPLWAIGVVTVVRLVLAPYWMAKTDAEETAKIQASLDRYQRKQSAVDKLSDLLSDGIREIWNSEINSEAEFDALEKQWENWRSDVETILKTRFTHSDLIHFSRLGVVPVVTKGGAFDYRHEKILREYALKETRLREIIRDHNIRGN